MPIPSSQLNTWASSVSSVAAKNAHEAVRRAMANHTWPGRMSHEEYLQGSYANSTNIRADSDVDLVVETGGVAYSNLSAEEKKRLRLGKGSYGWKAFRAEVVTALRAHFAAENVDATRNKCICVAGTSQRLPIDVVPAVKYKRYSELEVAAVGMTFWTQRDNTQVINYPMLHLRNGQSMNKRVGGHFKPAVRMMKHARNHLQLADVEIKRRFPSYFVECLLYNVADASFVADRSTSFESILRWLSTADLQRLVTQSRQHYLFGQSMIQWNLEDGRAFIAHMIDLWNNWA